MVAPLLAALQRPANMPPPSACGTCGQPATSQWVRAATEQEATQHWDALERNIRTSNSGKPEAEYVADRSDTVVKAVYGCDEHAMPAAKATLIHKTTCTTPTGCKCK